MRKTLSEIAEFIKGEVVGDRNLVIKGLGDIKEAQAGDLTFVSNPKYFSFVEKTRASAIIVPREFSSPQGKSIIRADDPSLAFAKITTWIMGQETVHIVGIHPTAVIAPDARLGKRVAVGPYAVIESNVQIGDGSIIYDGSYIGHDTTIGRECLIYPKVTIREKITIGDRVIIHPGAVIGADGFGFNFIDGAHHKVPQLGVVIIHDDVEIGANVTIDRARLDKTEIGQGTKIDNLVHIAHNAIIGKNCLIVAQAGVSGSAKIGNDCILAGQSGVVSHVSVGDKSVVLSQALVTKSIPAGSTVYGFPARPEKHAKKVNACVQRLPKYVELLQELRKKLDHLEEKIKSK